MWVQRLLSITLSSIWLLLGAAAFAEVEAESGLAFEPAEGPYSAEQEDCLREAMINANPTITLGELEAECEIIRERIAGTPVYSEASRRLIMERRTEWNPFVITPHNANYILPFTYNRYPNSSVYQGISQFEDMDREEAKLQVSLKVPLNENDVLLKGDGLYFAVTLKAFWQVYNHAISAPFRETNYRPEIFYFFPLRVHEYKADTALAVGFEHESNGRTQLLSRSWNRVFLNFYYAKDHYMIQFRPWYRIPEEKKEEPMDPDGDDNPDIHEYMGYFELSGIWERDEIEYTLMLRNNLKWDQNRGAVQAEASFPLWGRMRGMVQYFNGYGESLIDYDHRVNKIGFGLMLTESM